VASHPMDYSKSLSETVNDWSSLAWRSLPEMSNVVDFADDAGCGEKFPGCDLLDFSKVIGQY